MRSAIAAAIALLAACDNSPIYTPYIARVGNGVGVPAGAIQLAVYGNFFAPGAVVFWDGKPQATSFVSDTQLAVDLAPGLTADGGTFPMTARNPNSFLSEVYQVWVVEPPVMLADVSPREIALGAPDTTITLTGSGFRSTKRVVWNNVPLATTLQSDTVLLATVPTSLLGLAQDVSVTLTDSRCSQLCTDHVFSPQIVSVGLSTRKTIRYCYDAAWDAVDSLFVVSTLNLNSFATLDPGTGAYVQIAANYGTPLLAVPDEGQFVYAFSPQLWYARAGTIEAKRFSLPGLTGGVDLTGVPTTNSAGWPVQSLAPAPGTPTTVAALTTDFQGAPQSVQIIDQVAARAGTGDGTGLASLEWGLDASTLYALPGASGAGVVLFKVDSTGIISRTVLASAQFKFGKMHFDRITRRLYGDSGESFDEAGLDPRPFAVLDKPGESCAAGIDGGLGKAFFACTTGGRELTVRSFDLASRQPISSIVLDPVGGPANRVLRFGSDGLAVLADGTLYLYQGPFIR